MGHMCLFMLPKKKKNKEIIFYKPDLSFNSWVLCYVGFC